MSSSSTHVASHWAGLSNRSLKFSVRRSRYLEDSGASVQTRTLGYPKSPQESRVTGHGCRKCLRLSSPFWTMQMEGLRILSFAFVSIFCSFCRFVVIPLFRTMHVSGMLACHFYFLLHLVARREVHRDQESSVNKRISAMISAQILKPTCMDW